DFGRLGENIPRDEALLEQQMRSGSVEQQWWHDRLVEGWLPTQKDDPTVVVKEDLHAHYVDYVRRHGRRYAVSGAVLGRTLHKFVPALRTVQLSLLGDRRRVYRFPPLKVCRAAFGRYLNQTDAVLDWDSPLCDWQPPPAPPEKDEDDPLGG